MSFTKDEQNVIIELEKRAGDVLYLKDIAPYFISKSCLQISTYTQTAYIQVGDNMQKALSEYFQLVVFLKKMEKSGACFSIPYTPLEDNEVQIGNDEFSDYQQHTIADGDLLIQLFHFGSKKYVIAANFSDQFNRPDKVYQSEKKQSKTNLIIPSFILLLLFLFIGVIGYVSYEDHNNLKLKQEAISADLKKQSRHIGLLSNQFQDQVELQKQMQTKLKTELASFSELLEGQNRSLRNIWYWNRKQSDQLEKIIQMTRQDSVK